MSDGVSWGSFITKLSEHLGTERRAQTIFCEQTKYTLSSLQHYRKKDCVPHYVVAEIDNIKKEECDFVAFRGFHKKKFADRLVELSAQKKSLKEMADILSKEFNRKVTENAVKGARYRHREKIESYRGRETPKRMAAE
jgi:hypothetical protein